MEQTKVPLFSRNDLIRLIIPLVIEQLLAVTIGMAEILGAKKIRLGVFRDWHRSVVRQAAYGEVSAHFPATLIQRHPDAMIIVNANAAKQPF